MRTDVPVPGRVVWCEGTASNVARAVQFDCGLVGGPTQGDPDTYRWIRPDGTRGLPDPAVSLCATCVVPPTGKPGGVPSAHMCDRHGSLSGVYRFLPAPGGR